MADVVDDPAAKSALEDSIRKIEVGSQLIVEDGATTDSLAAAAAAKLVRQDKVDVLFGGIFSSTRQAIKGPVVDLGYFYIAFGAFVIVAFGNAVNLTDGLDGLAIMPTVMVGFLLFKMLPDKPRVAPWLSGHEKDVVEAVLAAVPPPKR